MTAYRTPWDDAPAPPAPAFPKQGPGAAALAPKRRGRRPATQRTQATTATGGLSWHYHHLTVSGPTAALASFVAAARGPGVVPWRCDPAAIEEDVLNLVLAQPPGARNLSAGGCRILARQVRMAVDAHQARAARDRLCPLDLHALLPVPEVMLARGPDDREALAWMREHWGVTAALRHPALRPGATAGQRLPAGHAVVGYGFHTGGGTPQAAIAQLGRRWPALRFELQPQPAG